MPPVPPVPALPAPLEPPLPELPPPPLGDGSLPEHADVDVGADLQRLRDELRGRHTDEVTRSLDFPRHTQRVLAELLVADP